MRFVWRRYWCGSRDKGQISDLGAVTIVATSGLAGRRGRIDVQTFRRNAHSYEYKRRRAAAVIRRRSVRDSPALRPTLVRRVPHPCRRPPFGGTSIDEPLGGRWCAVKSESRPSCMKQTARSVTRGWHANMYSGPRRECASCASSDSKISGEHVSLPAAGVVVAAGSRPTTSEAPNSARH